MSYPYSLACLFFSNRADYDDFYERCRVGPANTAAKSLPLTKEFEQALKLSSLSQRFGFWPELYPCHLFMAASDVADAAWLSVLPSASGLQRQLLAHITAPSPSC